jgi:hypothetical protein
MKTDHCARCWIIKTVYSPKNSQLFFCQRCWKLNGHTDDEYREEDKK